MGLEEQRLTSGTESTHHDSAIGVKSLSKVKSVAFYSDTMAAIKASVFVTATPIARINIVDTPEDS